MLEVPCVRTLAGVAVDKIREAEPGAIRRRTLAGVLSPRGQLWWLSPHGWHETWLLAELSRTQCRSFSVAFRWSWHRVRLIIAGVLYVIQSTTVCRIM